MPKPQSNSASSSIFDGVQTSEASAGIQCSYMARHFLTSLFERYVLKSDVFLGGSKNVLKHFRNCLQTCLIEHLKRKETILSLTTDSAIFEQWFFGIINQFGKIYQSNIFENNSWMAGYNFFTIYAM